MFLLGMGFMFFVLLIFSILAINPRDEDEYRTHKGRGTYNNDIWNNEDKGGD